MEPCGVECHDLLVSAFIEFDRAQMGHFQFGTARGWLDCRFVEVVAGVHSKGIASKDKKGQRDAYRALVSWRYIYDGSRPSAHRGLCVRFPPGSLLRS